jgi:demethylmenaquinone methyltransferase/2-methoxy-6-polyprenyl-1,4-benzoquinol methylase
MFSGIAPRYDLLNHLLSLSLDRVWRRRTARRFRHLLRRPGARVLDLCCGTGDLALALAKEAGAATGAAGIFGSDFAHAMLLLARKKGGAIRYFEADALRVPVAEASFDLVTVAFGCRNLANYQAGLAEMFRILKPGGEAGILEFSEPAGRLFGPLYRFYFRRILPAVGGIISGSRESYAYLPSSVRAFPSPDDLRGMLERAGFREARTELWTGGAVALHSARRP